MQGAPAAHAIHQSQTPAFSKHFFSRLTRFFPALSSPFHLRSSTAQLDRVFLHKSKERLVYSACCQAFDWSWLPSRQCGGSLEGGRPRCRPSQPGSARPDTPDPISPRTYRKPRLPPSPFKIRTKTHKCAHTNDFLLMRDAKELHKHDDISTDL